MNDQLDFDAMMKEIGEDRPELAAIREAVEHRLRRRRWVRQSLLIGGAAAAVGVIAMGAMLIVGREADTSSSASGAVINLTTRCYATADEVGEDNFLRVSLVGKNGAIPSAGSAIEMCAQSWSRGALSATPPYIVDQPAASADQKSPELTACVLPAELADEGMPQVAVFPGTSQTCGRLGLVPYTG